MMMVFAFDVFSLFFLLTTFLHPYILDISTEVALLGLIQSNNFCPLIRAFCLFTMNTTADIEVYYLTVCLAF